REARSSPGPCTVTAGAATGRKATSTRRAPSSVQAWKSYVSQRAVARAHSNSRALAKAVRSMSVFQQRLERGLALERGFALGTGLPFLRHEIRRDGLCLVAPVVADKAGHRGQFAIAQLGEAGHGP